MGTPRDLAPRAADHDESFEELVAAAALGCIEPDDAVRLCVHLDRCEHCRHLLGEYGAVVDLLPMSVTEAPAAPALKSRLLVAAAADLNGESRAGTDRRTPRPAGVVVPIARPSRLRYWLPLAAMLVLSVGLGWWNAQLQAQLRSQQAQVERQQQFIAAVAAGGPRLALSGTDQAPDASGEVVQPPGGAAPLLVVQGLPELPPHQEYQVWVIRGGQPAGAGLLRPEGPTLPIIPLEHGLAGAQTVALTIEPRGGSPGPTGPIVMAGNL